MVVGLTKIMWFGSVTYAVILLCVNAVARSGVADENRTPDDPIAVRRQILNAFGQIASRPGWEHFDEELLKKVESRRFAGEPLNVRGRVLNPEGAPLPQSIVILRQSSIALWNRDLSRLPQDVLAITVTDENGGYHFPAVPQHPEINEASHTESSVMAIAPDFGFGWTILRPITEQQFADISLSTSQVYEGEISDGNAPIDEARVALRQIRHVDMSGARYHLAFSEIEPRAMSRNGRFRIEGIPTAVITSWQATHPDYELGQWSDDTNAISFVVKRASTRVGRVLDRHTGLPIANVELVGALPDYRMRSDDHGNFTCASGVQWPDYVLPPSDWFGGSFFGMQIEGDVTIFQLWRARRIKGRVVDEQNGEGVGGVRVYMTPGNSPNSRLAKTITDVDGGFLLDAPAAQIRVGIEGPVDGYLLPFDRITTDPNEKYPELNRNEFLIEYDAAVEERSSLEFRIAPEEPFEGTVVNANGDPVADVEVALACYSTALPDALHIRRTRSNREGHFRIVPRARWYGNPLWLTANGPKGRGARISLAADADRSQKLRIALLQRSMVRGSLQLAGSPAAGVGIRIVQRSRAFQDSTLPEVLAVTATDQNGAFEVSVPIDRETTAVLEPLAPAGYSAWRSHALTLKLGTTLDLGEITLE